MDFDPNTKTFSNFRTLVTPPAGVAVWPSFLPTNDGVVFELQTVSNLRDFGGTRSFCDDPTVAPCTVPQTNDGAHGELWWIDLKTLTPKRLDTLNGSVNGSSYLPSSTDHTNDVTLNYEPTANPVASGGYAWVVFTSRRAYGNVATINPFWSDPRFHDISVTPTTKKLWVAAIDLNAPAGTDPSHPAFYLPAQELLAGNARGFWVVDPCKQNGTTCETGDECCGGYCRPSGGGLVCTQTPGGCAQEFEKCRTSVDCCASNLTCIDGLCAQATR
jgi:hypothetical protein